MPFATKKLKFSDGFTLVELSIVLTIIGLVVGGTMIGIGMVNQARLRSDVKSMNTMLAAVAAFKDKYTAYPGDFSNAYSYFGASCGANSSGATGSCNGDGNAQVNQGAGLGNAPIEDLLFWSHLTLSTIYPGSFTGTIGGSARSILGTNVPAAGKLPGGFGAAYISSANAYGNPAGNFIWYGALATATQQIGEGYLSPSDAQYVDQKIDDGNAGTGNMLAINGASYTTTDCVNAAPTASSGSYILTSVRKACYMVIRIPN